MEEIRSQGLFKPERVIVTPQQATVAVSAAGRSSISARTTTSASPTTPCRRGRQTGARPLGLRHGERAFHLRHPGDPQGPRARLSEFLRTEDSILYSSCFDANGGLFETLLGKDDAVISDELNHASIIDGIRLCAAQRYRYHNRDMAHLEEQLREASGARRRLIATDGVFSMDGYVAPLAEICELAERYGAMVMVDDSHAVGFIGAHGRGTPELHQVADKVDIVTGTLGKALGGASGGYVSGRHEIIDLLRQRSRPYLFSNSVAPAIAAASLVVLDLLDESDDLRAGSRRTRCGSASGWRAWASMSSRATTRSSP